MNKRHFTLVEVLVVVGIIGILAGLVFPAVGMARQAGRRTECVSNQGQLMKLLTVTMNANDNYLVSGTGYGKSNDVESSWSRYLYDKGKLQSTKGFRCPAIVTGIDPTLGTKVNNSQLAAALGVVAARGAEGGKTYWGFDFRGTKRLTAKTGSTTFVVSPIQLAIGGCSGRVDKGSFVPRANLFSGTAGYFFPVHGDEFNMYFLDGHVETVTPEKAVSGKFIPDYSGTGATEVTAANHIKNLEED